MFWLMQVFLFVKWKIVWLKVFELSELISVRGSSAVCPVVWETAKRLNTLVPNATLSSTGQTLNISAEQMRTEELNCRIFL